MPSYDASPATPCATDAHSTATSPNHNRIAARCALELRIISGWMILLIGIPSSQ